jgi:hypothetical protein
MGRLNTDTQEEGLVTTEREMSTRQGMLTTTRNWNRQRIDPAFDPSEEG